MSHYFPNLDKLQRPISVIIWYPTLQYITREPVVVISGYHGLNLLHTWDWLSFILYRNLVNVKTCLKELE